MAKIATLKNVISLRKSTGYPILECKNALIKCNGNLEKAVEFLRKEYNLKIKIEKYLGKSNAVHCISGYKGNLAENNGGICSRCGRFVAINDISTHNQTHLS